LNQIPKVVQAAAYGTEDLAFFRHNGFRLGLIRRALILFLERGYYAYGGSTISQQLVKNLFLTRKKTLSRKFQEAVIVWKMEKEVSKERIFELYLNCIEYGPRIWGISKAARVYFGKHPTQLRAMGAAFIMGLKPDPKYGYLQFSRGKLNRHWRVNLDRVLKRLLDMGAISKSVYDQTMRTNLRFHKPGQVKKATPDEDRPVRTGQEGLEEL
jgi:membrane peptidoglycan carboxypeptidase